MNELDKVIMEAVNGEGSYSDKVKLPRYVDEIKQAIAKHVIGEDVPLPATIDGLSQEEQIRAAMAKGANLTRAKQRQKLHGQ